MNITSRTGALACITSFILVSSVLYSCAANAQTLAAGAGAQAIAVAGGGGGSGDRVTGVATTPDAIAPSSATAIGSRSCYVPATSDSVSAVFVSYGGARWMLDDGCEARADAEAFVGIAYARADILGDMAGAARLINLAERRMSATRDEFTVATSGGEWPDIWRP